MPRLLIFCDDYPKDMANGLHLRVWNLCEQLALQNDCFLISLSHSNGHGETIANSPFVETRFIPRRNSGRRSLLRYIRLSNAHFAERSSPTYYREVCEKVQNLASSWKAEVLISFATSLAEVGAAVDLPKIIDIPDCSTLTIERVLANRMRRLSQVDRMRMRLHKHRQLGRERSLLNIYNATTTISKPDRSGLLAASGIAPGRISVVPNGVATDFFREDTCRAKEPRSIVFWGNLDFPPNWTAISYFYNEIYLPYLADKDVSWHIVGSGANTKVKAIGEHPNIHLAGYQEDLIDFVSDKYLTINPMVEGSGLKNKVLEAFAMGLPVITTSLGVDAIDGQDGEHFLIADEPEQFASRVLELLNDRNMYDSLSLCARELARSRYSWPAIGRDFQRIINSVLSD